jgi:hypothetical protein
MYNPSKKVTEVLSEYLEFDPEQLKLGIWSGNLSLQDVNLREEAIYPHLNKLFDRKGTDRISKDSAKPPLRMKLISGSIGELSMKIPWKSLVWGQGDVSVEMRNVVLTLALESCEETRRRENGEAHAPDDTMDLDDAKEAVYSSVPSQAPLSGDVKRRMIREAEKRLLTGRNVTGWLRKTLKDEQEKRRKELDTRERVQEESKVEKWLKGATSDFFWRFYTGLQMKIENLKIVIVQDGVEVGVVMPSIQVLADVSEKSGPGSQVDNRDNVTMDSTATPPVDVVYESAYEDGEHVDKHIIFKGLGVYVRQAVTAEKLANRSSMVHVNDVTTKEFIIRPFDFEFSYSLFFPFPLEKRKKRKQLQVSKVASEDIESADGTPSTSSTKRRRGKREKVRLPSAEKSAAPTETTGSASFPVSISPTPGAAVREHTAPCMSTVKKVVMMRRASIQAANQQFTEHNATALATGPRHVGDNPESWAALTPAIQQQAPKPKRHARRSSLAAPLMGASAPSAITTVSKLPPKEKNNRTISAPLALPNSVKKAFAAAVEGEDLTTRLDSRLKVSAIQVVFSTRQYQLLDVFLASSARMRNGRPRHTIKSVLGESAGINRGIAVLFPDFDREGRNHSTDSMDVTTRSSQQQMRGTAPLRSEMGNAISFRAVVIRGWWNYAYSVVVWELRQRKRLRRMFQDRFLSFNWERQRHSRSEYVRLFIGVQLAPQATPEGDEKQTTSTKEDEDELLRIEDDLPVEQVLLYRAIARVLHVRGLNKMPVSIVDLRARQEKRRERLQLHHSFAGSSPGDIPLTRTSRDRGGRFDSDPWNNMPQILAVAGKSCELTRRRLAADHTDFLPQGEPFAKFSTMFRRRGLEESTTGMTIDTRVTKAGLGRKSRMGVSDTPNTSMKFSFTASLSKVEFLLIEDEGIILVKSGGSEKSDGQSVASSVGGSDVSGLTDDIRAWGDDETTGRHDDTLNSEPIMNSTDFLLYKEPEITLLQVVLTGLGCSALGQSGGSRNLNLKVGNIEAIGSNTCALLSVGTKLNDSTSVAEVAIMGEPHPIGLGDEYGDAMNFSLVLQEGEHIVQCDMARIKTCMDVTSVSKILRFPRASPAAYPSRILPRSGREEARLQVLNQSASTNSFVFMDSSIRIQGINILFPVILNEEIDDDNDTSVGSGHGSVKLNGHEEGTVLRIGMVEFYSGTAVAALTGAGHVPTPRSWGARPATRKLKMLDMEMFEERNSSLLSYDWVRTLSFLFCLTSSDASHFACYRLLLLAESILR